MVNVFASLSPAGSLTCTVMLSLPGPWASVGVQVKAPVAGSIAAPDGAPLLRLKTSVLTGSLASFALAVNETSVPSATERSPIGLRIGTPTSSRLTKAVPLPRALPAWSLMPGSITS